MVAAIKQKMEVYREKEKENFYSVEILEQPQEAVVPEPDCVTLITVIGLVEVEFDGAIHALTSNNVLLLKQGSLTYIRDLKGESKVCALHIKSCTLDDYIKTQMSDCPIFYDFLRLKTKQMEYLLFDITFDQMVKVYVQILFYEATRITEKETKYEKNVRCALILLLTNLHYDYQKNLIIGESTMMEDYEIGKILKYVADHYATVTLSSAAKAFNFHPAYFSARFKKLAHCSFSEKLLQIRLEQAKRLLATSDLPVQAIVEQVGFSEKSYFYKVFKRDSQMTPMEYRKLNQKEGADY